MHFSPLLLPTDIKIKTLGRIPGKKSGRLSSSLGFPTDKMGRGLNVSSAYGNSSSPCELLEWKGHLELGSSCIMQTCDASRSYQNSSQLSTETQSWKEHSDGLATQMSSEPGGKQDVGS